MINYIVPAIVGLYLLYKSADAKTSDKSIMFWDTGSFRENILQWSDIITEEMAKTPNVKKKMDLLDILAMVYVESAGNPNATGAIGEVGLMQVTKETAFQDIVDNGYIKDFSFEDIRFSPRKQIFCGLSYLDLCWKKVGLNADKRDIFRAYNAGYGRIRNGNTTVSQDYLATILQKREIVEQWLTN